MEYEAFSIRTLLFLFVVSAIFPTLHAIYLEDYCNQQYKVYRDVRIKLMYGSYRTRNFDCKMTLVPATGSRLTARFTSYTSGDDSLFASRPCAKQAIFLNDFFGRNGYCSILKPSGNYDLGQDGTFRYVVDGDSSIFSIRVAYAELIVTEVTDRPNDGCPSGFFDCEKDNACIDDSLTCNKYDDCGNDRDEIEGCGLSAGIIVGIVFGVIGFVGLVIVAVLLFKKCR